MILAQQQQEIEILTCEELEVRYNKLAEDYNTLDFGGTALLGLLVVTYLLIAIGFIVWFFNKRHSKNL